jgi:glycosyltransferase involved in cell wall biosynthesis
MMLSIIIPCKNEESYIGRLFESLAGQSLPTDTEILVADAMSTDKTLEIIEKYSKTLPIRVISGGLPSVGRNNGALEATGDILLFIDSDCYFNDPNLISSSVDKIKSGYELVGALLNIEDNYSVRILYSITNIIARLSKLNKPFVVGAYFMITKDAFNRFGGFDETLMHCEDYFLSKQINGKKFSLVKKYIYTDDRRFKKMGKLGMIRYFFYNTIKRSDKNFFKKDIGYWS